MKTMYLELFSALRKLTEARVLVWEPKDGVLTVTVRLAFDKKGIQDGRLAYSTFQGVDGNLTGEEVKALADVVSKLDKQRRSAGSIRGER